MPVRGQSSRGEDYDDPFNGAPFEFNGQWWAPVRPEEMQGAVTYNPDDYADQDVQNIFRNYGLDLRPRDVNGVAAVPFDDKIRFNKTFGRPESFIDKWGAFPMLAAVIGANVLPELMAAGTSVGANAGVGGGWSNLANLSTGTMTDVAPGLYSAPMQMGAGAAGGAAAGGAAGGAAGSGFSFGLPQLAQGASVLGGAAALANAVGGNDSSPVFDIYGGQGEVSPQLQAAQGGYGSMTGNSLDTYNGVMNPGGMVDPSGAPVMNGMNWGQLGNAATGMANVVNATNGPGLPQGLINSALPAAAQLGGAALAANATNKAIDAQTQGTAQAADATAKASQAAIDEMRRQYDLTRSDYAPYREVGNQAVGRINGMLQPGGDLTRKFTVQDFYNDPVVQLSNQFGLDQGMRGIDRAARANGMLSNGATLKALTRYGNDYGAQKAGDSYARFYGDQDRTFNRNAALAGIGQTATNGVVNAGTATSNNIANVTQGQGNAIGNLYSGLGNSRGAAAIASGNTFNNALSNIGNWWTNQNMLDTLMSGRK